MKNIWFTSDQHYGHANILTFKDKEGNPIRPFSSVEEMNETMIDNHNKLVKTGDIVYNVGDITFDKKNFPSIMGRLTGSHRIAFGNHDDIPFLVNGRWFKKTFVTRRFDDMGFMVSHYPLATDQFYNHRQQKQMHCVHGHTHGNSLDNPLYINVSVEVTNFAPVHMDEILSIIKSRS